MKFYRSTCFLKKILVILQAGTNEITFKETNIQRSIKVSTTLCLNKDRSTRVAIKYKSFLLPQTAPKASVMSISSSFIPFGSFQSKW
jgi:hypothetical protein